MVTYGKLTPKAMHQNNINFLAPYNPWDHPELLFKQCADSQEIAIIAKVPYMDKQLFMTVIGLLTVVCTSATWRNGSKMPTLRKHGSIYGHSSGWHINVASKQEM